MAGIVRADFGSDPDAPVESIIPRFCEAARRAAGWSPDEAAIRINSASSCGLRLTGRMILAYEDGRAIPRYDVVLHMCAGAGVPILEWLRYFVASDGMVPQARRRRP